MTQPMSAVHQKMSSSFRSKIALRGRRDVGEVAAGRVQDALGLAGRAARVEDEERVLGVELRGRAVGATPSAISVVPPVVAARPSSRRPGRCGCTTTTCSTPARPRAPRRPAASARSGAAAPVAAVGGDDELRAGVVDAVAQRLGREAAEDDAVRSRRCACRRASRSRARASSACRARRGRPSATPSAFSTFANWQTSRWSSP